MEIWRAWRASLRRPGFLLLASGVLALGVGASVAVYSLIDQVLLRPLPVQAPSQLMVAGFVGNEGRIGTASPLQYQHLGGLGGVQALGLRETLAPAVNIAAGGAPEQITATYADHGLLPTLGVRLALGRNFSAGEDRPNASPVVILTHGFWLRRYGGDPRAVGRTMRVEGVPHTIIGVLPESYAALGNGGQILLPIALGEAPSDLNDYMIVLRLADGASRATVAAEVDARLRAMYRDQGAAQWEEVHFGVQDLQAWMLGPTRSLFRLFLACALVVLLIAGVNLANLMLLRALARGHEAAVRAALGASSMRLALPALAEGLLVGSCGVLWGVLMAMAGLRLLQGFMPDGWLFAGALHVDAGTCLLAWSVGVAVALSTVVLGLWRSRDRVDAAQLREGGRSGRDRRGGRLGQILVVAQVALATTLLGAAGLFVHALYDAARTPLGFSGDGVLTFELGPVRADYPDMQAVQLLATRLLEGVRAIPGVTDAAVTTNLPADRFTGQFRMHMSLPGDHGFSAQYHAVGPEFFDLFGIALRKGRLFTASDRRGSEAVAIVNRAMAEHRFGGHALGKTIEVGIDPFTAPLRIVGVVADTRQLGPLETAPEALYLPLAQMPEGAWQLFRDYEPLRFALRGHGDPQDWRAAVQQTVAAVAPSQPIAGMRTMDEIVHATTASARLDLLLVGILASLAVLLATAGLYAVIAVATAAREHEFGVRVALGASRARLTWLVLAGGLWQVACGLAIGLGLALAVTGVLRAALEQIGRSRLDPLAMGGVCAVLAIAGLLACLWPALRAARVPPMRALRGE